MRLRSLQITNLLGMFSPADYGTALIFATLLSLSITQVFALSALYPLFFAAAFACGYSAWKDYHSSVGLMVGWTLFGVAWAQSPFTWLMEFRNLDQLIMRNTVVYAGFILMLVLYAFKHIHHRQITNSFIWVTLINIGVVFCQVVKGVTPYDRGGFYNNASMNACFIAVMYPFLAEYMKNRWAPAPLCLFAVLATGASAPLLTFAAAFVLYNFKLTYKAVAVGGVIGIGGIFAYSYRIFPGLFDDTGRLSAWNLGFRWWEIYANPLLGFGPGVTKLYFSNVEIKLARESEEILKEMLDPKKLEMLKILIARPETKSAQGGHLWIWFHNDFFQVMFEQGIVGLFLALNMVAHAFKKAFDNLDRTAIAALGATCVMGFFNYPLHLPLHILLVAVVFLRCFSERDTDHFGSKRIFDVQQAINRWASASHP